MRAAHSTKLEFLQNALEDAKIREKTMKTMNQVCSKASTPFLILIS
jgi:hypothetical protein